MTEEIAEKIGGIRNDRTHGASFLAGEGVRVLALVAKALASGHERITCLTAVAQELADARPAMASIGNMARAFVERLENRGEGSDPDALQVELLAEMEAASHEAAGRAAELLYEGTRVLTCSYSSAVFRTFKAALASGKAFSVAAVESRVGFVIEGSGRKRGLAYGQMLVDAASALGVPASLVADDHIEEGVSNADVALVGADTLLPDGGIVNGWPTLRLARSVAGAIPFYVVCESFKRATEPFTEEGFDLVPASLIARIITDSGPYGN